MTDVFSAAEIEAQIALLKTRLTAINTAITAILGGSQSYTLDTGQSRQTVTRADLTQLRALYKATLEDLDALQERLDEVNGYANDGLRRILPGF